MLKSLILRTAVKEYDEGIKQMDAGDYRGAIPYFTKAIEIYPSHPVFFNSRSLCQSQLGNHAEAMQDAQAAIQLDETYLEGHLTAAKCCLDTGELIALRITCSRALELDPSDKTAAKYERAWSSLKDYEDKYRTAYDKEDFKEGIFYMERALTYSPRCLRYKINTADCLVHLGKLRESLDITNKILAYDPKNEDAIYFKALCNYYDFKFTAAAEVLNLLFQITNDHQRAKSLRNRVRSILRTKEEGKKAFDEKKYYQALHLYEQALKIDPKYTAYNVQLHYNRAVVLTRLERFQDAIAACSKVLAVNKTYIKALIQRGRCYEGLKNWQKALKDYRAARDLENSEYIINIIKAAKLAFSKTPFYFYKLLEVNRYASDIEIKSAFRRKSLLYHPDKQHGKSKQAFVDMEEDFKDLSAAYTTLSNGTKRMQYDLEQLKL